MIKSSIVPRKMIAAPGYKLPVTITPYKQLNSLLGDTGGFRRGEMVVIVSPKNQYNKGLVNDLYLGHGLVNKPVMIDKTKKAVVLNISFCDNVNDYENQMSSRYRTLVGDDNDISYDRVQKFGYKYMSVLFPHPGELTMAKIIEFTSEIEEFDNELHLITIDDLSLIDRDDGLGQQLSLSELFLRLRHYFDHKGCTLITSLNSDEVQLKRVQEAGIANIPQAISRLRLYGGDNRIAFDVDTELTMTRNKLELDVYCGKHRGATRAIDTVTITADSDTNEFAFDVPFVE